MIRGILFDMDGLMFDTECIFKLAWDYAGEKCGLGPAGYMVEKTLGASIRSSLDIWEAEFGTRFDGEALRRCTGEFLRDYYAKHPTPVKPGLFALLEALDGSGFLLGVVSSSPEREVRRHLESVGITGRFDAVICGDMAERSKPAPDLYELACERLKMRPGEAIALEDSRNGLLSAYRAGCLPVMIPDLWQPDEETVALLYARFERLDQLIPFVKGLNA